MIKWTVVLKTQATGNSTGEWPYQVVAPDENEAVKKAIKAHKTRFPKWSKVQCALDIIEWPISY